MKKIISLACCVIMLFTTLAMTGCGSFFEEELLQIESIEHTLLEDGRTKIVIHYTDDTIDPEIFYIPKGAEGEIGETGNGIREILCVRDELKHETNFTIQFTDDETEDVRFSIRDGISIVGIEDRVDQVTGAKYAVFRFSDGTTKDIPLPKGDKGDRGNGIKDFKQEISQDGKKVVLTFTFDDNSKQTVSFDLPADGVGIASIEQLEDMSGENYILEIQYTDGNAYTVLLPRPQEPNRWYQGLVHPDNTGGLLDAARNGDYYFDTAHDVIYFREGGEWNEVVSFGKDSKKHTVTFDVNDSPEAQANLGTSQEKLEVADGRYLYADGYDVPTPTRAGYTFGGWYTKRNVDEKTMSPFTDLTPVFKDMTLYAYWIAE